MEEKLQTVAEKKRQLRATGRQFELLSFQKTRMILADHIVHTRLTD